MAGITDINNMTGPLQEEKNTNILDKYQNLVSTGNPVIDAANEAITYFTPGVGDAMSIRDALRAFSAAGDAENISGMIKLYGLGALATIGGIPIISAAWDAGGPAVKKAINTAIKESKKADLPTFSTKVGKPVRNTDALNDFASGKISNKDYFELVEEKGKYKRFNADELRAIWKIKYPKEKFPKNYKQKVSDKTGDKIMTKEEARLHMIELHNKPDSPYKAPEYIEKHQQVMKDITEEQVQVQVNKALRNQTPTAEIANPAVRFKVRKIREEPTGRRQQYFKTPLEEKLFKKTTGEMTDAEKGHLIEEYLESSNLPSNIKAALEYPKFPTVKKLNNFQKSLNASKNRLVNKKIKLTKNKKIAKKNSKLLADIKQNINMIDSMIKDLGLVSFKTKTRYRAGKGYKLKEPKTIETISQYPPGTSTLGMNLQFKKNYKNIMDKYTGTKEKPGLRDEYYTAKKDFKKKWNENFNQGGIASISHLTRPL